MLSQLAFTHDALICSAFLAFNACTICVSLWVQHWIPDYVDFSLQFHAETAARSVTSDLSSPTRKKSQLILPQKENKNAHNILLKIYCKIEATIFINVLKKEASK